MYKVAEEKINEGLSPFSRIFLGSISALFGFMMILIAPPTDKLIYFYLFGGFCLVIALACIFKGRIRQFLGSIIGLVLVFLSGWYLISQILNDGAMFSERSGQSIFNAILFTVFFGVPGLTYAIKTKFGFNDRSPNQ
ncbi:MAG: hypothetical protein COA86_15110 [Kangiella sp.]|nr:MAG: hypothetical protein COA86_15110 [Kangiella sp.]